MTKLQLLHRALNEHLMASLDQIMVLVSGTVLEYEEETVRVRKENEVLRRRLTVSTHQEPRADLPEQFSFEFGSEAPMVKQESACDQLCIKHVTSLSTMTETNRDITSTFTQNYEPSDSSYMAPLEFEPTQPQRNTIGKQRFSFACPVCAKVFATERTLSVHMHIHSKTRPYAVRKHKTFFYGEQKRKRRNNHLSRDPGEKVCGQSEVLRKSRRLDSTSPVESPAASKDIPKVTVVSRTSKVHKTKRKRKNRMCCPVCYQKYYRLCHLSRHMACHKADARNRLLNSDKDSPEETFTRNSEESEQNRNVTSADSEILAATSSQEFSEDSASDTEQMTDQIYPENPENDCLTHNLSEENSRPLEMENNVISNTPEESCKRESEESEQNRNASSADPDALISLIQELNEHLASEAEQTTNRTSLESHKSDRLTQNLSEDDTSSVEMANDFISGSPEKMFDRTLEESEKNMNVTSEDPETLAASSQDLIQDSTEQMTEQRSPKNLRSSRFTYNFRKNVIVKKPTSSENRDTAESSSSSSSDEYDSKDISSPKTRVSVMSLKKRTDGRRQFHRKNYCFFCFKPNSKITRHLEMKHKNEPEVVQAVAFSKGSKERKLRFSVLRHKGNRNHNAQVLKDGKGMMIPQKQSSSSGKVSDYMHCINCAAYLKRESLWRHMQNCHLSQSLKPGQKRVQRLCSYAEPVPNNVKDRFWKMVLEMNDDAITSVVREEKVILKLGQHLFKSLGHDSSKHDYIKQKMRETGRLVLQTKKQGKMKEVSDFFIPDNLPHVIEAINIVAGYNKGTNTYRRPSLAVKLGQNLMKIGTIIESEAIMSGDMQVLSNVQTFKQINDKWSDCVSPQTIKKLSDADLGSTQLQIIAEDVERMHQHLESRCKEFQTKLEEEPSGHHWEELAKVTLCQVIVLNLRREGEVSKMPLNSFVLRESSSTHPELVLTDLEKSLCKIFHSIEIPGKHGMNVLIFLTHDMVASMELLVKTRRECDALDENVFMFGIPQSLSHYKESEVVLQTARSCGSKHPEALYSPRLIKHVATMFTAINMKDKDMNDLLVHDVMSHQQDSMLPEGPLRLVKMCEMLMALEHEELSDFKERNADEIQINSQGETERILIDSNRSDSENETEMTGNEASLSSSAVPGDEKNTSLLPFQINEPDTALSYDASTSATAMSEEINEELIKTNDLKESHSRKRASQIQRTRWSAEEVLAVEATLMDHIISGTVPRKAQCVKCIKRSPAALQHRSWLAVKFYVKNRIDSLKKKL